MKSERDEALKEVSRGLRGLERRDLVDGRERGGIPRKGSNPSKDERGRSMQSPGTRQRPAFLRESRAGTDAE